MWQHCACNSQIDDKFHTGCFFTGTPPKSSKYKIVNPGVSRPIYVNVDSPNLGFPYFNFLGGTSEEKNTLYHIVAIMIVVFITLYGQNVAIMIVVFITSSYNQNVTITIVV